MSAGRRTGPLDPAAAAPSLSDQTGFDLDIEEEHDGRVARPELPHAALIFVGGVLGTLARDVVVTHWPSPSDGLPWAVMIINLTGAFVLGALGASLFTRKPEWVGPRLFLATGVLGGWTTYCTIITGTLILGHHGAHGWAAVSLFLSITVPVLGAGLGILVGSLLLRGRRT